MRPRARSARVCLNDHCFYASNASNATPDALQFLDRAAELGAAGIQFSVLTSFRELSDSYVDEVRARAESLGLSIEVGMGACNPYSDCRAARDTGRDPRVSLGEILPVARRIGSPIVRTFLGFSRERFLPRARLAEQIEATVAVLRDVRGAAEALGVRIALENHVDLTSRELVEMVERVDSPAIGVCFDTGNPLAMLEDPVESCRTLLPWICSSHLKDGVLCFDRDGGARWYGVLLGDGSCRVRETVAMLRGHHPGIQLNVEDLWDTFSVPLGRPDFLPGRYRASRDGLAEAVRWLQHGEGLRAEGRIPGREDLESDRRWEIVRERFPKNLERAKEIVNEMARAAPEAGA